MLLKRRSDESGAAAVEFALVVPVLLAIIFGIVDFSLAFNYRTQLNNAAIQSARNYVLTSDDAEALAAANDALPASGKVTASQVAISRLEDGSATTGSCPDTWTASPRNAIEVVITVSDKPSVTRFFGSFDFTGRGVAACR